MKVYDDKHIKNIVLAGAPKSGKTTLAEAMIFEAGLINRRGTVEEKNTVSDFHEVEHERGDEDGEDGRHDESVVPQRRHHDPQLVARDEDLAACRR